MKEKQENRKRSIYVDVERTEKQTHRGQETEKGLRRTRRRACSRRPAAAALSENPAYFMRRLAPTNLGFGVWFP